MLYVDRDAINHRIRDLVAKGSTGGDLDTQICISSLAPIFSYEPDEFFFTFRDCSNSFSRV